MKLKLIFKQVIMGCLTVVFCLSAVTLATSCQQRDYPTASQQRKINKKLPYLEFKTGYTGIGEPSKEDWPVILEASNRAIIKKIDGLWQMVIKSPKEGNMSPEVFETLRLAIENSNSFNKQYRKNKTTAPINPDQIIIR